LKFFKKSIYFLSKIDYARYMHKFKIYSIIIINFILSACQSTSFLVASVPTYFSKHYNAYKDIAYGKKPWQSLDIYVPKNAHNAPVVTFFYGGGWYDGDKKDYEFVADTVTKYGFIVVIPNYGKYPSQKYPAFQYDAARASVWISKHIQNYQGDVNNVHLMGHSAGAHIGAMLLADKSHLKSYGLNPNFYKSFVGLSGPYHFEPSEDAYKAVFSDLTSYQSMQVTHFIDGTQPPMLLIHGTQDGVVSNINTKRLAEALDANKCSYHVEYYDTDHTGTIAAFTNIIGVKNPKIVHRVIEFMRSI
jgi:acetyl esterase/lipase